MKNILNSELLLIFLLFKSIFSDARVPYIYSVAFPKRRKKTFLIAVSLHLYTRLYDFQSSESSTWRHSATLIITSAKSFSKFPSVLRTMDNTNVEAYALIDCTIEV